jgi:hypothetical protein
MKKASVVSLVFSCILFVLGVALIIASFRQALTPVSIQHYAEGFTMRLSINNLSLAITSISLMFLILGCSLFMSSIILLALSSYFLISSKKESLSLKKEKSETKQENITKEKMIEDSVKAEEKLK